MNAKQAIKEELHEVVSKRRDLIAQERALKQALAALDAVKPGVSHRASPRDGRQSAAKRLEQTRAEISAQPKRKWRAKDLKTLPKSSGYTAIVKLIELGEVEKVGETSRGGPIVRWAGGKPEAPARQKLPEAEPQTKPKPKARKKIKRTPRLSLETRKTQIVDFLRADSRSWHSVADIAKAVGLDPSRVHDIMPSLMAEHKVNHEVKGNGPRAPHFYRYRDQTIIPGLGLRSQLPPR